MDTLDELCVRIVVQVDMIELVELLDISVSDLVERFEDRVMTNQDALKEFLDERV